MSAAAAQFQFGSEFVAFLAAAAGVALLLLRVELVEGRREARIGLVVGLTALASAAFLDGAHVVPHRTSPVLVGLRLGGAAIVALASVAWPVLLRTKALLVVGVVVTAGAVVAAATGQATVADAIVGLGGVAIGGAILDASRRSVAARIAASGAVTLLVLVLVLSVAQSAVIDSNIRKDAVRRLASRAQTEAAAFSETDNRAVEDAAFAATAAGQETLYRVALADTYDRNLSSGLKQLNNIFQSGAAIYVSNGSKVLAAAPTDVLGLDNAGQRELAGSSVVHSLSCSQAPTAQGTEVVGRRAYAVGGFAVCQNGVIRGRMAQVIAFDAGYLETRNGDDKTLGLALMNRSGTLAATGAQPSQSLTARLVAEVVADGQPRSATAGSRFVSVVAVRGAGTTAFALVASSPTATVVSTRDRLFRTLFVIALVGTLLALLLAAVVGERIGMRLRRLTTAAEAVRRGESGVRARLPGNDEVGALGASFDAMAESIEDKEGALREAAVDEARLRSRIEAVIGGMGEALVAVDADGRITDFNRAAEELVGVSAVTARDRNADQVVCLVTDDGTDLSPRLKRPSPARWTALASLAPLEGGTVPVAVSGSALRGPDAELVGGVFVLRDLRSERAVERMKSEFLSRASHELRSPLTVIIGYGEMLLRRTPDPEQARHFQQEIMTAAERLDRVVEMLEFFAAVAADRNLLRPKPMDVRTLVDDVVRRWDSRIGVPHNIVRRVARGLPKIEVDRKWLEMALNELIDNAVKFSPMGGNVEVAAAATDDGLVEMAVTDRGIGMTVDEQAMAFGDFVQGDASDTRRFSGLGLGLPLVARVAEGHGGRVTCLSTPGRGSRLAILLPPAPPPPVPRRLRRGRP